MEPVEGGLFQGGRRAAERGFDIPLDLPDSFAHRIGYVV
jgi:hypothetical protein